MGKTKILLIIGTLIFVGWGLGSLRNTNLNLELEKIELKDTTAELKELQLEYDQLNLDFNRAIEKDEKNKTELERLKAEKERLEAEKQRLERELQAKKEAEKKLALNITKPVYAHSTNCEDYRHLVERYDWNHEVMLYAMKHESGCNSQAVGDNYTINGVYAPSCGLLQVRTLQGRPSCEQLKNPSTNVATAYKIWQGQGYCAWTVLHGTPSCQR